MKFLINIDWVDPFKTRRPMYTCLNFVEIFLLGKDRDDIIDTIELGDWEKSDKGRGLYEVDEKKYEHFKKFCYPQKVKEEIVW